MNAVFESEAVMIPPSTAANTIFHRVVDALLRENVRDCVGQAKVVSGRALPFFSQLPTELANGPWLRVSHLGEIYIAVEACDFMQPWRLRELTIIQYQNGQICYLDDFEAILAVFQQGLSDAESHAFVSFVGECQTAVEQSEACLQARDDYFLSQHKSIAKGNHDWAQKMLHYERLAAFLDHPFYPTARAKLGFSTEDLAAYAPEFGAEFELRWLAVSKTLYREADNALPAWWPSFSDVGLPENLANNCHLLPVHPFMWQHHLQPLLNEAKINDSVVLAPTPFLAVAATLSVRTVIIKQSPQWHLKLPLSIRTLGAKNIRTIKPSTIKDGDTMQLMLRAVVQNEPQLNERLLLSDESRGADVAEKKFLGFILRQYPSEVSQSTVVSVAALTAETPLGTTVFEELAQQFYQGDVETFFEAYVSLTLQLHLTLWVRYGVALESNQQNSMLVLSHSETTLRLLLKDNDAGRILPQQLSKRCPTLVAKIESLHDRRILVDDALWLAKMFTTITLQLNIAVLIEGLVKQAGCNRNALYDFVRSQIECLLTTFEAKGESVKLARQVLLEDKQHYLKYLLRAASLENKASTGASDVNKFYGKTAPNSLLTESLAP